MSLERDQQSLVYRAFDTGYAKAWYLESQMWLQTGFYDQVVKVLLQDSEFAELSEKKEAITHLDLGCGYGFLFLSMLRHFGRDSFLAGVEVNSVIHKALEELLPHVMGINTASIGDGILIKNDLGILEEHFPDSDKLRTHIKETESSTLEPLVRIVRDDIRSLAITDLVLGDREVDVGTFLFPGAGPRFNFQAPYLFDRKLDDEEQSQRNAQVMLEVRIAAFKALSKRVRTGGRMIVAERGHFARDGEGPKMIKLLLESLQAFMGENIKYWDLEKLHWADCVGVQPVEGGVEWVTPHTSQPEQSLEQRSLEKDQKRSAMIASFKRNDVPYEETAA